MADIEQENPTRTKLLDAAEALMLARGYNAASVDAICDAAGVTKGSFFHYFKNKEALGKVLVARFGARQEAGFHAACGDIADPLERVYCYVECAIQASRSPEMKGCLVGTLAQEINETMPEIRQCCGESFNGFLEKVSADLVAAKAQHCPDADFDAEGLSSYFLSIAQGSMLLVKATGNRELMERNLVHFRDYVRSLFGR